MLACQDGEIPCILILLLVEIDRNIGMKDRERYKRDVRANSVGSETVVEGREVRVVVDELVEGNMASIQKVVR